MSSLGSRYVKFWIDSCETGTEKDDYDDDEDPHQMFKKNITAPFRVNGCADSSNVPMFGRFRQGPEGLSKR